MRTRASAAKAPNKCKLFFYTDSLTLTNPVWWTTWPVGHKKISWHGPCMSGVSKTAICFDKEKA
jgi:hypothetical protein